MTRSPRSNPFVYSRPLTPAEAAPRTRDADHLVALAEGGHNATLVAPRRMGKTSLLNQVQREAENAGMHSVLVDLSDVLSIEDVAARLDLAFRKMRGPLGKLVSDHLGSIGLALPFQLGGITAGRPSPTADATKALHGLLELPVRIYEKTGKRVLVALDEFQALAALKGMDGVFRSHLQHQGEAASYLFAGSEPTMLRTMFADRARPLYGQAEIVVLDRLDAGDATVFVRSRFEQTRRDPGDTVLPLVGLADGHPQRLVLLAHHLWGMTEPGSPADMRAFRNAFEVAMRQIDPELRFQWDGLPANERRVLRAVASELSPMTLTGMSLAGLASRSSAQSALRALVDAGVVERGAGELPRIVDPLFAHWIRRNQGARPSIYILPDPEQPGYVITDGPSLAFVQQRAATMDDADQAAARLLAGRSGNIIVFDTEDPNDLPSWALGQDAD